MPQGEKSSYTEKQKRQAKHIEASYRDEGVSEDEAEARAWATVNKQDGGGKKSGTGRARPGEHAALKRRRNAAASGRTAADRSEAAKKGARTRARNAGSSH